MDILDQFGQPMSGGAPNPGLLSSLSSASGASDSLGFPDIAGPSPIPGMPAVHIPEPFSLANADPTALEDLREEILDKEKRWEQAMNTFFYEWREATESWRIQSRVPATKRPKGLFNSKSGETHRATETLATLWFRMLTASDQFYEAVGSGLDPFGSPLDENDLYAVERVILTQLRWTHFKPKLLKSLRSLALFGTIIFEEPWIMLPSANGQHYFEGTDLQHRSMLQTGFDTTAYDIEQSDYIFTIDYPTIWRLRDWARMDPETWDREVIESELKDSSYSPNGNGLKPSTNVYSRINERKQRAGYITLDKNVRELLTYHGKIDTENSVIQQYWESLGRDDDPQSSDFTIGLLDGEKTVRLHMTQYKTWHSRFKTASYKTFELEPMGYGVGKIGRKAQREIDSAYARANDASFLNLYGMYKIGRFSGLKAQDLNIRPLGFIEMDDITQMEQLKIDVNAITQSLAMQAAKIEDFRASTGATNTLQAASTDATATEATLTQTEGIRGASVFAECIAETLIREHIYQMHVNNLDNLDSKIWVAITGEPKPRIYDRNNLPRNVGFEIRVTTDKNYRPERNKMIMDMLQLLSSIRNIFADPQIQINAQKDLIMELWRNNDLNPRKLTEPVSIADQMLYNLRRTQNQQNNPALMNENEAQVAGGPSGINSGVETPMGPVPTSPVGAMTVPASGAMRR